MDVVSKKRPVILMVDDDEKLLAAVRRTLSSSFDFITQIFNGFFNGMDHVVCLVASID